MEALRYLREPANPKGCYREVEVFTKPRRELFRIFIISVAAICLFPLGNIAGSGGLAVGDQAPAFELLGSDGETHSLADHYGERVVVLAWFPKAFTGG